MLGEGNGSPLQYSCLENPHGRRSLVGCSPWGRWGSDMTERLHFHFSLSCIGEGNGNPVHYSCLDNPRDGGVWWAAIYGVAQSQPRLKRLSSSSSIVKLTKCLSMVLGMQYGCEYMYPGSSNTAFFWCFSTLKLKWFHWKKDISSQTVRKNSKIQPYYPETNVKSHNVFSSHFIHKHTI